MPLRRTGRIARDAARERLSPCPPFGIELAQLRHRLLNHPATVTHRANQLPVHVRLAILLSRRVPQVHESAFSASRTSIATRSSPLHHLLRLPEYEFDPRSDSPTPPSL